MESLWCISLLCMCLLFALYCGIPYVLWRAHIRLLVETALHDRGVNIPSIIYRICSVWQETVDHVFIECILAFVAHEWVFRWCQIPNQSFSSASQFLNFVACWGNFPRKTNVLDTIVYCLVWCIWIARSNTVFKKLPQSPSMVVNTVVLLC